MLVQARNPFGRVLASDAVGDLAARSEAQSLPAHRATLVSPRRRWLSGQSDCHCLRLEDAMDLWPPYVDSDYVEDVRSFVRQHIAPIADQIDRDDIYPTAIVKTLARQGLTTITLPPTYGGGGKPYGHAVALFEEVSYASAAVGISLITIFQAQTIINLFGNDAIKKEYLPEFAQGLLSSYALTEAAHGSDIRTLDTKAVRAGDSWVLTGEKSFITSGSAAQFFLILADTPLAHSVVAVPPRRHHLSAYVGTTSPTLRLRTRPHVTLVLQGLPLPLPNVICLE